MILTKWPECPHGASERCRFQHDMSGTSTCMGWGGPVFDRAGNRLDKGDPNIRTSGFWCLTCRARWSSSTQYEVTETTLCEHGHLAVAPGATAEGR